MHAVAEQELQPEAHAARRAAHTARNVDKERMRGIHGDALRLQLLLQALGCHCIAEKQRLGVLVVHKIAPRVPVRQRPAVFTASL